MFYYVRCINFITNVKSRWLFCIDKSGIVYLINEHPTNMQTK